MFDDKLSEDSRLEEQFGADKYNQIADNIDKNKDQKDALLQMLKLPYFDKKENPRDLKKELLSSQHDADIEKEKLENERKRLEIRNKRMKEAEKISVQKGTKAWLVSIMKTFVILNRIQKEAIKARLDKRKAQIEFQNRFNNIYQSVATTWIRKAIRNPLLSLYGDTDQSLLFTKDALSLYLDRKAEETKRLLLI